MESEEATAGRGVVVPALWAASSVAVLRSLGGRGVPTIAVSEHDAPPGFSSKYTDETRTVPDPAADLERYALALRNLAMRDDVSTIVPVREPDVYVLARAREEFADHVGTPWPPLETLRSVQDRARLFAAADRADVDYPDTELYDDWADWDAEAIVKPRYTFHAAEYDDRFAESQSHHNSTQYVPPGEQPDRADLVDEMGHVPLVQEYVPNTDEYAFFALYDEGEAVATFQHRQRRGYKYVGGPSSFRESVDIPELGAAGRRLLDELDWHGLAMVEFLRDPTTGEFKLMEVNPRFWTSLPFTVQAGVDFPYYYWLLANDRADEIVSSYDVGVAGHLIRGELLYLHSILFEDYPLVERPSLPSALVEIGLSVARHPRFDYLSRDDPGPFLQDFRNVFGQLVRSRDSPVIKRQ
ncbi:carboxylate--amine ligase [Halobacteriales archaeon Cl-PHB]